MAVIGLDVGSSGCKAGLYLEQGKLIKLARRSYAQTLSGSFRVIDPRALLTCVFDTLREVAAQFGGEISGVSVSSFGESCVCVDGRGEAVSDIMLYTDPRGAGQAERLLAACDESRFIAETGVYPAGMYSLAKMMYYREKCPEIYAQTRKFMLIQDYIIYKLTGEAVLDYSLASRTMAFDVGQKRWSSYALNLAEIPENMLSRVCASGTLAGGVTNAAARETGLAPGTSVFTGGHDQVCAAVGSGILSPGESVDGLGSVECITPLFERPLGSELVKSGGYVNVPYADGKNYVTYAFNFTSGALIDWYRNTFFPEKPDFFSEMEANMPSVPSSVVVLPYFAGAATPHMDPSATGVIAGLKLSTDAFGIYRAVLEGTTFEMKLNLERLESSGVNIRSFTAAGGGASSEKWMQLKADVLQVPFRTLKDKEAGVCGAAMLASVGSGESDTLQDACRFITYGRSYEPNASAAKLYDENYQKYKSLYVKN